MSASEFDAVFFDGRSSARKEVRVRGGSGRLRVTAPGVDFEVFVFEVRPEPPIAGQRYLLHLPGGAQLQTEDVQAVQAIFGDAIGGRWVRALEARWRYALGALAFIAAAAAWAVVYGLPMAAQEAARRLPPEFAQRLGAQSLATLDRSVCSESTLPKERRLQLERDAMARVLAGLPDRDNYRVAFRNCRAIGPNAFALPGGTILVTDALVRLMANDEEVAAVLAHEVGHAHNRHPLRLALQATGLAALIATLANDAVSITSLAVALPTLLLQTGYSRAFEDEADGYALARLRAVGISPARFAEALQSLQAYHAKRQGSKTGAREDDDYLSTHPATSRRIERALKAANMASSSGIAPPGIPDEATRRQ